MLEIDRVNWTTSGETALGRTCRKAMRQPVAPAARAA